MSKSFLQRFFCLCEFDVSPDKRKRKSLVNHVKTKQDGQEQTTNTTESFEKVEKNVSFKYFVCDEKVSIKSSARFYR